MTLSGSINSIDTLIGRKVVSRATANKLGQVHDLIINPVAGRLAGLSVKLEDEGVPLVACDEIYSFGPDAVMINNDRSALPPENSPLKDLPFAMNKLVGAEVITEDGKILGQVANVFIHLSEEPLLIYEVRSSLFDKLLGRALFFPASFGRAFSAHDARLVVVNDSADKADNSLEALAARLFGPPKEEDPIVVVRSRG
jgi:uncharacterized protein YrrD